jgi:hypothetical protein
MRFCGHVPNSHRNKNLEFVDPYLLLKMDLFGPRNIVVPLEHYGKKLYFNFECYGLAIVKE